MHYFVTVQSVVHVLHIVIRHIPLGRTLLSDIMRCLLCEVAYYVRYPVSPNNIQLGLPPRRILVWLDWISHDVRDPLIGYLVIILISLVKVIILKCLIAKSNYQYCEMHPNNDNYVIPHLISIYFVSLII